MPAWSCPGSPSERPAGRRRGDEGRCLLGAPLGLGRQIELGRRTRSRPGHSRSSCAAERRRRRPPPWPPRRRPSRRSSAPGSFPRWTRTTCARDRGSGGPGRRARQAAAAWPHSRRSTAPAAPRSARQTDRARPAWHRRRPRPAEAATAGARSGSWPAARAAVQGALHSRGQRLAG